MQFLMTHSMKSTKVGRQRKLTSFWGRGREASPGSSRSGRSSEALYKPYSSHVFLALNLWSSRANLQHPQGAQKIIPALVPACKRCTGLTMS